MFIKKVLPVAIAATLVGCGGGSSSSVTPTTLSGSVVKGIVVGGDVTAYDATGAAVGTSVTGAKGEYSITLDSSYTGGPLKIEVVGNAGATMKCDVAGGCDDDGDSATPPIAFGETIKLTSSFKLKAVVPETTGTEVSTHLTALTDMAANLAERNSPAGTLDADAVSGANSQVANLFGLTTEDLTSAKPVDITDADAIATATVEELRSALYSAAVLGAVLNSDRPVGPEDDIGAALKAFADDFVSNDGQMVVNDDADGGAEDTATVSFEDVLEQVIALTKEDTVSAAVSSVDSTLEQEINDDLADATDEAANPIGEITDAQPSPDAASEDVQQAQAMIADLRGLAYALGAQQGNTANESMQTLVAGGDLFAEKLSIAGDVTGPAADYLIEALGMATSAMAGAAGQYAEDWKAVDAGVADATIRTVFSDLETGIDVSIAPVANATAVTISVSASGLDVDSIYTGTDGINLVNVDLAFTLTLEGVKAFLDSMVETPSSDSVAGSVVLDASLAGTLTGPTAKLWVLNTERAPSKVRIDAREIYSNDAYPATPTVVSESALIDVDGSLADWISTTPYWQSTQDDAIGDTADVVSGTVAPGTDIKKAYFRASNLQLAFGIEMADAPVYPHTPSSDQSRYEVMMRAFSDDSCSLAYGQPAAGTSEPGVPHYFVARNKTTPTGTRSYLFAMEGDGQTDVSLNATEDVSSTTTGELVELLVPQSYITREVKSVLAKARVRYVENGAGVLIDQTPDVCIPLQQRLAAVDGEFQGTWGIAPSDISLQLAVKLEQLQSESVPTPAAFEGAFSAALTGLDYDGADQGGDWEVGNSASGTSTTSEGWAQTEDERFSFTAMSLGLSGTFSRGDEAFDARFAIDLDGSGYEATETLDFAWWDTLNADSQDIGGDYLDVEKTTQTGFITGSARLSFEATIAGVSNSPAKVVLDIARTTETTGTAGLTLTLGADGKRLALETMLEKGADSANPEDIVPTSVTITNQDGIVITLKDPEAVEDNISTITKGQEQLGTVTEESGIVTFRLRDGSHADVTLVETL